jgi:hypothetical protein
MKIQIKIKSKKKLVIKSVIMNEKWNLYCLHDGPSSCQVTNSSGW